MFGKLITGGTLDADINTAVIDLLEGLLIAGTTKAEGFVAVIDFLSNSANASHPDLGDIAQSFQNRADAAEYFSITKELGGSTDAELAAAIASVTSDADTLEAANAAADATASAEEVVAGQTFTLTTGLDTLTGASTNDTFSAVDSAAINGAPTTTLNAGDSINAGSGTDRLSIAASTGSAATSAAVSSSTVEEIALYNNSGAGYTVDTSLMTGLTDLYVAGGNSTAAFTGVNSSPNVHLTSANSNVTVTNAATVGLGDADAVTIALNGAAATGNVTLSYNDIETFNVVSSGAATGTSATTLTLSSDQLETVNVSGSAAAKISATMTGAATVSQVGTLDASDMTGALTATVVAGASGKLSVTGGTGADTLTVNGGAMNSDLTIDGGAGVDTLVVTSAAYSAAAVTQAGAGVTNMEVLAVLGSADARAFSNNTFAGIASLGAASITGLGTDAVSLTATAGGNQTLDRATDGAADVATVSLAGAAAQTIASLNVADEETVTINSGSLAAGSNAITAIVGTDLTSLTIAGSRDLTIGSISGTKLATLDASGLSGTGTQLVISAANSTADMTVTGAAGVESSTSEVMNNITTGSGDDAITTGDYNDTINAGDGNNTVVAGDGDNVVTTGRGNDTITVGDGNNTITAGIGNDTVTAGGTTTTAAVFDTNTVNLGTGNDTYTGGAGRDIVTLGAGDDTVDTGAGTDSIYMSDFDDDDVVNGGAGADTLSAIALVSLAASTTTQIQAVDKYVTVSPGTSLTSSPQFTGVETVYMEASLAAANDGAATDAETIDFAATTGITNLYLEITDLETGANDDAKLTLSDVDATAIHLSDRKTAATAGDLATLVIGGTSQSLTVKGYDFVGATVAAALTVTDVDALTITSYTDTALVAVGDTQFGAVTADDAETVTVTMAGTSAALAGDTLTLASLSADGATAINLNAGSFNTLAITGDVTSTSDALDTMAIVVSDDGTLTANEIRTTASAMSSATITLGVASTLTVTGEIDLESVEDVTVTVGAASTLTADDFIAGGDVVINATMGSNIGIDVFGGTGITGTFDINGRGNLGAQANQATKTIAMAGTTTLNIAGYTDTTGGTITINAATATKATFVGNNQATSITTGAGADSITGGTGIDTIVDSGAGDDVLNLGAGDNVVTDAGAGDDTITTGAGNDTVTDAGAGDDTITLGGGIDSVDAGPGADSIVLTETVAALDNVILSAAGDTANFALNAGAVNSVTTVGMDIITGMDATDTFELSMYTGIAAAIGADTLLDTDEATQLTTGIAGGTLPGANSIGTLRGTYDADNDTFVGSATGVDLMLIYDANPLIATTDLESVVLVGGGALTITVAAGAAGTLDIA